jgi:hypothetical protein
VLVALCLAALAVLAIGLWLVSSGVRRESEACRAEGGTPQRVSGQHTLCVSRDGRIIPL